ncbi:FAD dependent oxidoreductase [Neolentinus lepideus HHB14362 ss-1]|uniref:FAD dependent oxidoreductase n=1 Tax=Neolentinus lepideus HHB14362 ss-1 TaxID=1314782 RepID=A0A165PV91_9AGAM|nr:FAD dependent oxidoreductase [Neolentinus lepideus HHB14362 ss-1]
MSASKFPVPLNQLSSAQLALTQPTNHPRASLPVPNPTKSFWLSSETDVNPLAREGSEGPLTADADICIIGSGITGISTAYHLSKLLAEQKDIKVQLKVVILEAREFCSGATGRNGGHLTSRAFIDFRDFSQKYGQEEVVKSIAIEQHTVKCIIDLIKAEKIEHEVDLVSGGHVDLAILDEELAYAKADFEAAKAAGLDLSHVKWFNRDEMQSKFGTSFPGIYVPGHNLWPLKLVTHLFHLARKDESRMTLNLHTCTPVMSIDPLSSQSRSDRLGRRWKVSTPRGSISCAYVVHATNAYASHLLPHMHGPQGIIPTRGQVAAVRANVPIEDLTRVSWTGNTGFEYWFPRPVMSEAEHPLIILGGGREAAGPRYETYTTDDSSIDPTISKALRKYLPHLFHGKYAEGREPEMEWSGIMGFTAIGDPFVGHVGRGYEGQYIAAGYSGHGMPKAFSCAEVVAQMIIADISGKAWSPPEWLPKWYLTSGNQ